MSISKLFNDKDKQQIVDAIKTAELDTSGEIRVHIESKCSGDPYLRAVYLFSRLKMFKTRERNAVLIYLALKSRKFAIVGDVGINEKVPPDFWNDAKEKMAVKFSQGQFVDGISEAVLSVGKHLKIYFSHKKDDINEQSDEISFGS